MLSLEVTADLVRLKVTLPICWVCIGELQDKALLAVSIPSIQLTEQGHTGGLIFLKGMPRWILLLRHQCFQTQPVSRATCGTNLQREIALCLERIKISSPTMALNQPGTLLNISNYIRIISLAPAFIWICCKWSKIFISLLGLISNEISWLKVYDVW